MIKVISSEPDRYKYSQFSIHQILPKTVTDEEVTAIESLYKKKLRTIEFGLNDN